MIIQQLTLVNFRNIKQAEISFSEKINCFLGSNGAGKTNILDAIYFLSYCKSHHNNIDSQNIAHGADFFILQGNYLINKDREENIYCGLKKNKKKQFKRNKKEYSRLSEHIGLLPLVLVSPNDQSLIAEGSENRRRFMDSIISQYDHEYLNLLICYNNALQQRNALLKQQATDDSLFDIWESQMDEYGTEIHRRRLIFIEEFSPLFQRFHSILSSNNEMVSLQYQSQLLNGRIIDALRAGRTRDLILGYSATGIHRDDLEMKMGDYAIKKIGSQGQNKTYLIALKLAQFDFLKKTSGVTPLLLLDDIFDKLDTDRVRQIIQLVSKDTFGQIFITDTNREHMDDILSQLQQESYLFTVKNGEIDRI